MSGWVSENGREGEVRTQFGSGQSVSRLSQDS